MSECPFCAIPADRIIIETPITISFFDVHPISEGHALVIPRKHVSSIYELTSDEQIVVWNSVAELRQRLTVEFRVESFNIGINDGLAAGQTVAHAHIHVIPRRLGDVPDPRGGIRWIIANAASYWEK